MESVISMSLADIILTSGIIITLVGGAIRIGTISNQISINTKRICKLEDLSEEFAIHSANTTGRWPDIERRLSRAETIINHVTIRKEFA